MTISIGFYSDKCVSSRQRANDLVSTKTWPFKAIGLILLAVCVGGIAQANPTAAPLNSVDQIVGLRQDNANALGYYPNANDDLVGNTGSFVSLTRYGANLVLGYTLPTLPVGTTVDSAVFDFEITGNRDESNSDPSVQVHLLDVVDPDSSGTTYFFNGPTDTNTATVLVDSTYIAVGVVATAYADDLHDQAYVISGDALTLLKSYYGGDNVPDRTEVFFRFSLDIAVADTSSLDRYYIDLASNESSLEITSAIPETTPPTLVSGDMVDDVSGGPVFSGNVVTYTVTFSEDIDETTVDASDFSNAGTAAISIGSIAETSPGVFTVPVTPTNVGSLQLQVNASAVITDLVGNALDTTAAILDDTTITVTTLNYPPVWDNAYIILPDATEDSAYSVSLTGHVTDLNDDVLVFSKVSGPAWFSVAGNGTLTGTPTTADVGLHTFVVSVSDSIAPLEEATLEISVYSLGGVSYMLSYFGNGATGGSPPSDINSPYDPAGSTTVTVLGSGSLAKTDYSMTEWNTSPDGSGTGYTEGATFTISKHTNLYAQWTPDGYPVTYNANGATSGSAPDAQDKPHDGDLTLAGNSGNLILSNSFFLGWNTAVDGSGTDYAEGATYSDNAPLTLYAKWGTDIDLIKARIKAMLSSSPDESTIAGYQSTLQPDGTWADINYAGDDGYTIVFHLQRLLAMAQMVTFGSMQGDATLLADTLQAYDGWIREDPASWNWFHNEIGWPDYIGHILIMLEDHVSAAQLNAGLTILTRSYLPRTDTTAMNSSANRTTRAYNTMMRGLLTNDEALVAESFLAIGDEIVVRNPFVFSEGIQADGSYAAHGEQLYTFGYGSTFLLSSYFNAEYGAGTVLGIPYDKMRIVDDHILDGARWFMRGDNYDLTAMGRGVIGGNQTNTDVLRSTVKRAIQSSNGYRLGELQSLDAEIDAIWAAGGEAVPAQAHVGNRNFWFLDIMAHHRSDLAVSVKTSSTRTRQPESGNGEGLKSRHLADGVTLIKRTGNEYDNITPVWDWGRLPGTTIEQDGHSLKPTSDWGVFGTSTHAGGVSDGWDGAAVFDYSNLDVAAKKSWFFIGDVMVALGSEVNAPAAASSVLTSLNQCLLNGSVTYKASGSDTVLTGTSNTPTDLDWVFHDGVGYFFPSPVSNVTVKAVTQSGSMRVLDTDGSTDILNEDVFSLYVNHGSGFTGQTYAYMVAPVADVASMDSYPVSDLQILSNTGTVQAVKSVSSGLIQANFYGAGSVDDITVSHACSIMVRDIDGTIAVTVSDPTQALTGDLTVQINRSSVGLIEADGEVTVDQYDPTITLRFNMTNSVGRSLKAKFYTTPAAYSKLTLSPVFDAEAYEGSGDINYGTSTTLRTRSDVSFGDWREAFLQFDLSGVYGEIVAARLVLNPTAISGAASLQMVAPMDTHTWTETGLTWNNRPSPMGGSSGPWLPATGQAARVDVLDAVKNYKGSGGELSLMLAPYTQSEATVTFASRESESTELRPVLELTFREAFAVDNSAGASAVSSGVRLNGWLTEGPADVTIYWGTSDGDTTPENWDHVISLGSLPAGSFFSEINGLSQGTTYYYRAYASGGSGAVWSGSTSSFAVSTLTFDANGGSATDPVSKQVVFGASYDALPTTTRSGFNFVGWYTAPTGGDSITSASTVNTTANHTLYAQWNQPPEVDAGSDQFVSMGNALPWTPDEIATEAWFDAADTATITHSGGAVSQWDDKSGNDKHLGQSAGTNQPVTGVVTVNGENALQFTGDFLFNASGTNADIKSVVMVTKNNTQITSASGAAGMLSIYGTMISSGDGLGSSTGALTDEILSIFDEDVPSIYVDRQGVSSSTLSSISAGTHMYSYVRSTDWFIGLDGSGDLRDLTSGTRHDLLLSNGFGVGGMLRDTSAPGNFFDGAICEVLLLSTSLSEGDRQKLEGYLAHKWGQSGSLPLSHPYQVAAPTMAGAIVNLDGTVSDPEDDALTTTWSVVSGPALVEFGDSSLVDTTATFTANGSYTLRLTANDASGTTSDDIVVQIGDVPTVTAWPTAEDITQGEALSSATLSGGSASVAGSFSYDAPSTIPGAGIYSAAVTFTPTDTTNYLNVSGSVDVTVSASAEPFDTWAATGSGVTFGGDTNNDGIADGIGWLLGASNPAESAAGLVPDATENSGALILNFQILNAGSRGSATLGLQYSKDLGVSDNWSNHTVTIPESSGTVDGVVFVITPIEGTDLNQVQATVPESAAGGGSTLFSRLIGEIASP